MAKHYIDPEVLRNRIDVLDTKMEFVIAVIRRLEWSGREPLNSIACCPDPTCRVLRGEPHFSSCSIKLLLDLEAAETQREEDDPQV